MTKAVMVNMARRWNTIHFIEGKMFPSLLERWKERGREEGGLDKKQIKKERVRNMLTCYIIYVMLIYVIQNVFHKN